MMRMSSKMNKFLYWLGSEVYQNANWKEQISFEMVIPLSKLRQLFFGRLFLEPLDGQIGHVTHIFALVALSKPRSSIVNLEDDFFSVFCEEKFKTL